MKKYYYDLHIHSCLSPCADDSSTPDSIAGMGELNGLNIMALTDHNTCKNCPAFFEAAYRHGILPVAGTELTTAEDIHVICLFGNLSGAMAFDKELQSRRTLIKNRTDIFGNQFICDSKDNITGTEDFLLSNATDISIEHVSDFVEKFGGISYPAHIDRNSNGVISVLGTFPKELNFNCAEVHDRLRLDEFFEKSGIEKSKIFVCSDAHYLWDIKEKEDYFIFDEIPVGYENTGKILIDFMRNFL